MEIELNKEEDNDNQIQSASNIYKAFIILLSSFISISLIFIIQFTLKISQMKNRQELLLSIAKVKIDTNGNITNQISKKILNI